MVLKEEVLLLISSLLDSFPIDVVASSDMSLLLWVTPLLELEPVAVSENIFLWEGVAVLEGELLFEIFLVIVREYFTFGGCCDPVMSNASFTGTATPLSLELAQGLWRKGLFRLVAFSGAHCWQIAFEVLNHICPYLWQL